MVPDSAEQKVAEAPANQFARSDRISAPSLSTSTVTLCAGSENRHDAACLKEPGDHHA